MEFQVAKIVGTASEKSWSQIHVFRPKADDPGGEEKLAAYGELMAALEFKVLNEAISVSSFGKEIIQRLQEIYFANDSEGILKKLAQTMETLAAEFQPQVELSMVVLVAWEHQGHQLLYCGRQGGGQVYLKRGEAIVPLFSGEGEEAETVSGEINIKDKLLVGTKQFFHIVPEGIIASALEQSEVNDSLENLASVVHGHEQNSQAAGIIIKVSGEEPAVTGATPDQTDSGEAPGRQATAEPNALSLASKSNEGKLSSFVNFLKPYGKTVSAKISQLLGKREIRLSQGTNRQKKSAATIALVLILVFAVSVVLAGRKRQQTRQETEIQALMEGTEYRVNEAKGLLTLNPLRAKSLLQEAQASLNDYRDSHEGELPERLQAVAAEIETLLGAAQREYDVEATEWYSFDLVSEGFRGTDWEADENNLWAWDEAKQVVVQLSLTTKASEVVTSGETVSGGKLIGLVGPRGFLITGNKIIVLTDDGEGVAEVGADEWGRISDAVGFGSNLYLLDSTSDGQVWKYNGVEAGLGSKQAYLKGTGLDLSSAVSMAIDGSVWVLFDDGTIVKYVRGDKDSFVATGLDEPFGEPIKIYTSPEVENLYILDRAKTRVVVIGKNGEYQAQYGWSGIAGAKDLVVSEEAGKIYLLTGEKIFAIDLQK